MLSRGSAGICYLEGVQGYVILRESRDMLFRGSAEIRYLEGVQGYVI